MTLVNGFTQNAVDLARQLQVDVDEIYEPPETGRISRTNEVIDPIIVADARGYVKIIVNEINGTYENGWYGACAMLLRRLMEMLIFEVYRSLERLSDIEDPIDPTRHLRLSDLITTVLNEPNFDLDYHTKTVMPKLRTIGNQFTHSRRTHARRSDIEQQLFAIRVMVEDLHGLVVPGT